MNDARRIDALRLLLRRLTLRSHLGNDEKQAVLDLPAEALAVKAQVDFVQAGERLDASCLVEEGLVARFEQLEDGRRQIISLHVPGDLVDLHSLLLPRAPAALQAVSAARIVRIPHAALRAAIARWPDLGTALWRDTVVDGTMVAQSAVRLGRRDAYARVAHLLCEMTVRYDEIGALKGSTFQFPITQEQLADAVGLTSVHVNRTLRSLREHRLVIVGSSRVQILDWPGLQQAAGFDPAYLCVPRTVQPAGLVA